VQRLSQGVAFDEAGSMPDPRAASSWTCSACCARRPARAADCLTLAGTALATMDKLLIKDKPRS
jgi:hypothetical protein